MGCLRLTVYCKFLVLTVMRKNNTVFALSGPGVSPTESLAATKLKQQLEKEKAKVEMQSTQIAELKQEMNNTIVSRHEG